MTRDELAYIGLGANAGAPREALVAGVAALGALPGASQATVSRLYRTRPVGPVAQGDFLNAVVGIRVPAGASAEQGAMALLIALKSIEQSMGRVERERWGPREIDLDLLLFGDHQLRVERDVAARSDDPARAGVQWLEVPHASAAKRSFVLAPLAELAPGLEPPGWGISVTEAFHRARVVEGEDAVEPIAFWDRSWRLWVDG